MNSKQDQAARLLELPANDYFSFGESEQVKLEDALMQLATGGAVPSAGALPAPLVALGAPRAVHLERQPTVPVLVASVASGLRNWQVNFRPNLHLLLRDLASGELSVAQPFVSKRRAAPELASGKGKAPSDANAATVYSSVERVDLRERLADAIKPGRFALTAVVNELASNTVSIAIEGGGGANPGKASAPQPYVRHRLETRPLPETVVQVPRNVSARAELAVRVALQVDAGAGVLKTGNAALWPSHVILIKLDERPQIIPAAVPVQPLAGGAYNAVFQVDVRAALKAPLAGDYQVYIDGGSRLLGPYPLRAEP